MLQGKPSIALLLALCVAGCASGNANTKAILNSSVAQCPDVYVVKQLARKAREGGIRHVIRGVDSACRVDGDTLRYTIQPRLGVLAPQVNEERVYKVDYLVVAINPAGEVFRRIPFSAHIIVPAGSSYGNLTTLLNLDLPNLPATQEVYIALP
jgi:hypothetical protein